MNDVVNSTDTTLHRRVNSIVDKTNQHLN